MRKLAFVGIWVLVALGVTLVFHSTQKSAIQYSEGLRLFKQNHFAEAVPFFEKAIAFDGSNQRAFRQAGYAYLWSGRPAEAIPFLQKASRMDTSDLKIKKSLAEAYVWNRQYDQAKAILKHLLRVAPGDLNAQLLWAKALNYSGEHAEAVKIYQTILEDLKNKPREST